MAERSTPEPLSALELAVLRAAGFVPCSGGVGYVRDPHTAERVRESYALELARKWLAHGKVLSGVCLVVRDDGSVVDPLAGDRVLCQAVDLPGFIAGYSYGTRRRAA